MTNSLLMELTSDTVLDFTMYTHAGMYCAVNTFGDIHSFGKLRYHAYSSWPANLCITKMSDPWTVTSNLTERQIIR